MSPLQVTLCIVVLLSPLTGLQARIGDTPEQLLARISANNAGRSLGAMRNLEDREREQILRESPIQQQLALLPASEELQRIIYWKHAGRPNSARDDGWRLHAYFLRGRSVAEVYHRVGQPLSDAEVRALLGLMRGERFWNRVPQAQRGSSVIGYEYELGDPDTPLLRARRERNFFIVFDKRLDDRLLELRAVVEEEARAQRAAQQELQERAAPSSVEGF
jgi:hypothetical protein